MTTLDFLKLVWPTQGLYLTLIPQEFKSRDTGEVIKTFKHFAHATPELAASHALALTNDPINPSNVFFALGSVKEDLTHTKKAEREALGKKVRGVHRGGHDNTQAVKAFWLDLDVGANDDKKYPTQQEAAVALRAFCVAAGMPKPLVVSSGGGLHCYWPLTSEIDPEQWQHYATILKGMTDSWGLKADASRTADRASILRPVGTNNWKTGVARPVQVMLSAGANDTAQLLARFDYLATTINLPAQRQRPVQAILGTAPMIQGVAPGLVANAADINAQAAAGAGFEPPNAKEVVQACQQLMWQLQHQELVPEPLWYAMIGVMRHTDGANKAIHKMSERNSRYSPYMTDAKIQQHLESGCGPTLCSTFSQHNPTGCQGCPHLGKIKTPVQAIRRLTALAPPTIQLMTADGHVDVELPPPPAPYKRVMNPMTGTARIAMTQGDDDGSELDEVLYEYDLFPSRLVHDERDDRYVVMVRRWLPKDGWKEFELPAGQLYDRRTLAITFGNVGVWPDLPKVDKLVGYMIGYIRDLQKAAESNVIYAQLGWRADGDRFVLPDRVITSDKVSTITPSRNIVRALSYEAPKGTLEDWKQIVATYERPGMEAHQFAFGVGFASPLFIHTNFNGMIVSIIGERGAGKSSAALCANSIWGHPKMGWGDMEHDTLRAFYNKLGVLNNLPATYDEHTNLDGETVSDLCYMVSKGQGRQRLKQNGEAQENHSNFQLMMLMTGNRSLNSRLALAKSDSSAESARVFEYFVPANTLSKAEADANWGPGGAIFKNYGVAAEVYAQQLMGSRQWSEERVKYWVGEVDRLAEVTSGERFWSAGVACVLTGFELANQCGLTNCDVDRLLQFAVRTIRGMRATVTENTRTPVNIVTDYINNNLRNILIITGEGTATSLAQMQVGMNVDKLKIRLERHTGKLYLDRAAFRRYCGDQQTDPIQLARELQQLGVLKQTDLKFVLGKGTQWKTGQSICWVLDANHHSLAGVGELSPVTSPSAPVGAAMP